MRFQASRQSASLCSGAFLALVLTALSGFLPQNAELAAQQPCTVGNAPAGTRVLVFSRTAAFRHASIPTGVEAVRTLGARHGFAVEVTEDPAEFRNDRLDDFDAVVFMSTTGDVLNPAQEAAFQRFIRAGGGFVGVHAASDTEHDWPWYGRLVGGYFNRHPQVQPAMVLIADPAHTSTRCLPRAWLRTDEWYDFKALPSGVKVLATLDEGTYRGGQMGVAHPIAWYHEFDGGRAWYTGLGHTNESFAEPEFLNHLAGGILWAVGQ